MKCECEFSDTSYLSQNTLNVTFFMTFVDLMIRSNCKLADACRRVRKRNMFPDEYDFIVVGAGVAGSVLASRLSEEKKWKILLIEAGPEEPTTTGIPAFAVSAIGSKLDWKFKTEQQKGACLSTKGICSWPRGKMIGGTGAMTGMMYTRGHPEIFNEWARNGNTGWSFWECLRYFKRAEDNKNWDIIEKELHGKSGPLVVQQFSYKPVFADYIIKAGAELGYKTGDLNGFNQTGFAIAQMMVESGYRASTSRMYLRPANSRENLFVMLNTTVTKIIINSFTQLATGVEYYDSSGKVKKVFAKKEIILSAGAIGSPHLLLLSGVGPEIDLKKLGMKTLKNLPVGKNLHNHVSAKVNFFITETNRQMLTNKTLEEYLVNRTGPLSSTGLTQTTAFLHSNYSNIIPDIQLFFDGFSAGFSNTGSSMECPDGKIQDICGDRIIRVRPTNVMTKSKGHLKLQSIDPLIPPKIVHNYFSHKQDLHVLIQAIKYVIKLTETKSLKAWNVRLDRKPLKYCDQLNFNSDRYWECISRYYTGPENHPAGTCKMGPEKDHKAVVDPELRVYGITNLRVIDASIFPYLPNSNPIAAIIMVAEKGSHMITGAWSHV